MRRALSLVTLVALAAAVSAAEPSAESAPPALLMRVGATKFRVGVGCRAVAYSTDGKRLYTGGSDGIVHVWDTATGNETKQWPTAGSGIVTLRLSPDGKQVAIA